MKNNFYKKGITLLEILIIILILGILASVVFTQFSSFKNNQILKGTVEEVESVVNKARSESMASLNGSQYGVRFETNSLIIFKGSSYIQGDSFNEIINVSFPATISATSLTGGGSEIYFNRLSGMPNKSGTITVSCVGLSKTITMSATGSVSVN